MRVIYNKGIPFPGFAAINLFGVIFARTEQRPLAEAVIRHEAIHSAQMRELLWVGFYVAYLVEWLVRLAMPGDAYRGISFEREAYEHQGQADYLHKRKRFAQWRR